MKQDLIFQEGLGYSNLYYLKNDISKLPNLYDTRYMGLGFKIVFLKNTPDSNQEDIDIEEDMKRSRTEHIQNSFDYIKLNTSYDSVDYSKDNSISESENIQTYSNEDLYNDSEIPTSKVYFPHKILETIISDLESKVKEIDAEKNQYKTLVQELETKLEK